jgi:putative ABC transport system substrate-binding protein
VHRRDLIKAIGSVALWPHIANAQSALPVVGFLSGRSLKSDTHLVTAFKQGLTEAGYVEGKNVTIDFRWADDQVDQLPALASSLVHSKVNVIFAGAVDTRIRELKSAISSTPAVFGTGGDLVELGIVASISRPGGNITGITVLAAELWPKQLKILNDLVGHRNVIGLLVNPNNEFASRSVRDVQAAAKATDQKTLIVNAKNAAEFGSAFAALTQQGAGALLVAVDSLFTNQREKIVSLANANKIPTVYGRREFAEAGGLISYGASVTDQYRQSGIYVGRILSGAKPADLPVLQPAKFELVLNLKTAKSLGLTLPSGLLSIVDEVIE